MMMNFLGLFLKHLILSKFRGYRNYSSKVINIVIIGLERIIEGRVSYFGRNFVKINVFLYIIMKLMCEKITTYRDII